MPVFRLHPCVAEDQLSASTANTAYDLKNRRFTGGSSPYTSPGELLQPPDPGDIHLPRQRKGLQGAMSGQVATPD